MDFDPRDYDSRPDDRLEAPVGEAAAAAQTIAIMMTTGGNLTSDLVIGTTTMRGRSAAVQEATGEPPMSTVGIGVMMHVGRTGTESSLTPAF